MPPRTGAGGEEKGQRLNAKEAERPDIDEAVLKVAVHAATVRVHDVSTATTVL